MLETAIWISLRLTCAHGELTAHRFEGAEARSLGARVRRLLLAREQGHGTGWTGTVCWILGSGTRTRVRTETEAWCSSTKSLHSLLLSLGRASHNLTAG